MLALDRTKVPLPALLNDPAPVISPLKLVLFEGAGEPGSLNHIGVEVESTDEVMAAVARAREEDLPADLQESTTCCYAVQDKVWIDGPDNAWEFYAVLADAPVLASDGGCCCS